MAMADENGTGAAKTGSFSASSLSDRLLECKHCHRVDDKQTCSTSPGMSGRGGGGDVWGHGKAKIDGNAGHTSSG